MTAAAEDDVLKKLRQAAASGVGARQKSRFSDGGKKYYVSQLFHEGNKKIRLVGGWGVLSMTLLTAALLVGES